MFAAARDSNRADWVRFCTNRQSIAIPIATALHRLLASRRHVQTIEEQQMNSFSLTAVGNLARNPEFVSKNDTSYTRFCLVGNDYAGKDEGGAAREVTTSVWFVAFGLLGETLARTCRTGDQLVVQARVRANNWTDKQGEKQYDHSFIVDCRELRQHLDFAVLGQRARRDFAVCLAAHRRAGGRAPADIACA
jgi:single-stranded DNA-binding protein